MSSIENPTEVMIPPPLILARKQRSHILFVLSNSAPDQESEFVDWYKKDYLHAMTKLDKVLSIQLFEQYEIDIKTVDYPPPEYKYLGIYELSLDGAEEAKNIIRKIVDRHKIEKSASAPATWLYYPISEKVGRSSKVKNPMLILAFANGKPGSEPDFREWYCTRHIRHVLNAPYNASGQCFELTNFQYSESAKPDYKIIAVYEQEGVPQDAHDFWNSLSSEQVSELVDKFSFPTLDLTRFGECNYRPITEKYCLNYDEP